MCHRAPTWFSPGLGGRQDLPGGPPAPPPEGRTGAARRGPSARPPCRPPRAGPRGPRPRTRPRTSVATTAPSRSLSGPGVPRAPGGRRRPVPADHGHHRPGGLIQRRPTPATPASSPRRNAHDSPRRDHDRAGLVFFSGPGSRWVSSRRPALTSPLDPATGQPRPPGRWPAGSTARPVGGGRGPRFASGAGPLRGGGADEPAAAARAAPPGPRCGSVPARVTAAAPHRGETGGPGSVRRSG